MGSAHAAPEDEAKNGPPVFTVGHSTRSTEELVALLQAAAVDELVDVRRYPASRRHPHFNRGPLEEALNVAGIGYRHVEILGGRRGAPAEGSPNTAWRSASFQAYADHLATEPARHALDGLEADARSRRLCLLCAEKLPWRCHRQLLADVLSLRGLSVRHLLEPDRELPHTPHSSAALSPDGTVIYPADAASQGDLFEEGE